MDEAAQKVREMQEGGRGYGLALAEFAIETFGSEIDPETADAVARELRSEILRAGGEMMDGGVPPALAIAWGDACTRALQERLAEHGAHLRSLAALLGFNQNEAPQQ
jgi:hypothetical protein